MSMTPFLQSIESQFTLTKDSKHKFYLIDLLGLVLSHFHTFNDPSSLKFEPMLIPFLQMSGTAPASMIHSCLITLSYWLTHPSFTSTPSSSSLVSPSSIGLILTRASLELQLMFDTFLTFEELSPPSFTQIMASRSNHLSSTSMVVQHTETSTSNAPSPYLFLLSSCCCELIEWSVTQLVTLDSPELALQFCSPIIQVFQSLTSMVLYLNVNVHDLSHVIFQSWIRCTAFLSCQLDEEKSLKALLPFFKSLLLNYSEIYTPFIAPCLICLGIEEEEIERLIKEGGANESEDEDEEEILY